jgi:selenocysteine-specific elongation factor
MQMLIDEKQIVKTKDDLFFDAAAVDDLSTKLVEFLKTNQKITTPEFKDMTGISRKYVIPLIEHFDAIHLTIRVEDHRQLRKKIS